MSTYEPCAQTNWPPQPEAPSQARESQLHLATSHSNRRLEELKWSVLDNLSRLIDQGIHGPSPRRTQLNLNWTSRSVVNNWRSQSGDSCLSPRPDVLKMLWWPNQMNKRLKLLYEGDSCVQVDTWKAATWLRDCTAVHTHPPRKGEREGGEIFIPGWQKSDHLSEWTIYTDGVQWGVAQGCWHGITADHIRIVWCVSEWHVGRIECMLV